MYVNIGFSIVSTLYFTVPYSSLSIKITDRQAVTGRTRDNTAFPLTVQFTNLSHNLSLGDLYSPNSPPPPLTPHTPPHSPPHQNHTPASPMLGEIPADKLPETPPSSEDTSKDSSGNYIITVDGETPRVNDDVISPSNGETPIINAVGEGELPISDTSSPTREEAPLINDISSATKGETLSTNDITSPKKGETPSANDINSPIKGEPPSANDITRQTKGEAPSTNDVNSPTKGETPLNIGSEINRVPQYVDAKVIVYAALSGMVSFLPDGTIHGCNHHFSLMLTGYSQEELLKRVCKQLMFDV